MTRRLLLLGTLLALLVAWDGWLAARDRTAREQSARIQRVMAGTGSHAQLAVVGVHTGASENFFYARKSGQWRCLSWRSALASGSRIATLVHGLLDAQGVVVSERPEHPGDYGLDVPSMLTVSLHGPRWSALDPQGDPIASFDLGAVLPQGGGSFLRKRGEGAVWAVDSSPGDLLASAGGPRRPPLLDTLLVPADWPGGSPRVTSVLVEHAGGESFELALHEVALSSAQAQSGVPPFEWVLRQGGTEQPASQFLAVSFIAWLLEAGWSDILDPSLAPALGLDRPRATLQLGSTSGDRADRADRAPGAGEPAAAGAPGVAEGSAVLRFVLGGKAPSGRATVLQRDAQLLYELQAGEETRLFPRAADFAPDSAVNPWGH